MPSPKFAWIAGHLARPAGARMFRNRLQSFAWFFVCVLILALPSAPVGLAQQPSTAAPHKKHAAHRPKKTRHTSSKSGNSAARRGKSSRRTAASRRRAKRRHVSRRTLARVHQLHHAFVASSQLRPMAQQLIADRTPQAYAGVVRYARTHSGEA